MDGTAINSYRVAVGAQASVFPELERLISTPAFVNSTQPALAGCQATDASSSSAVYPASLAAPNISGVAREWRFTAPHVGQAARM